MRLMTVHLFTRSCCTLLESTLRVSEIPVLAKAGGYQYAALTDHNVLFGFPAFSAACAKQEIRPIYGLEADTDYHGMTVPFLLLAEDRIGIHHLMECSSQIMETGKPISIADLNRYAEHNILIAYGEGGAADSELIAGNREGTLEILKQMKAELPEFDVAISYQESSLWKIKNELLRELCRSLSIRTVAMNKIFYAEESDAQLCRILKGIKENRTIQDRSFPMITGRSYLSRAQMEERYPLEELERTDELASRCHADLELEKTSLPQFPVPEGVTSGQYLTQLCLAGLKKRLNGAENKVYYDRLRYELDVILKMHFEDYFLIVWDFIRDARKEGIFVGPGRGSACGSLVAYSLGITMIDPIRWNLLFERFLNPDRVSMPDIDTDIQDNRRQDVIDYVRKKYGDDHIANIVTFGTLGAKQVIRDVGKVLAMNQRDIDLVSRLIPNRPGITLKQALTENNRLREIVKAEEKYQNLFCIAAKLEGLPRHTSIHAAGIIMSSLPLNEVIPTMKVDSDMKTSQYDKDYLEARGLIKMDFLGNRNLTTIQQIVKKVREEDPSFSLNEIPLDDDRAYQVFRNADTLGVFQVESEGMKALLRKIRPMRFEDITASLALFRPASKDSIPMYVENRRNPENIHYPALELEPILKETYGVMIYQEQAMLTAEVYAGFSLARADVLRKAMSKKKESELAALKQEFIRGAKKKGHTEQEAESLFALIQKFGGYGFNKSHAVAYAVIAYQEAWLKAEYPLHFYCALFDSVIGDSDKTARYADECRRRNIQVEAPNVMYSNETCRELPGRLLFPLSIIKGIGRNTARLIREEREKGQFEDFFDFIARISLLRIDRGSMETMIDAGALDCFGLSRTTMRTALDDALNYAELVQVQKNGQMVLNMSLVSKPVPVRRKDVPEEIREREISALGFSLGPHPIVNVRKQAGITLPSIISVRGTPGEFDTFVQVAGVRPYRTRRGDMMAFLKVSDETGEMDMAVMPRLYSKVQNQLAKGAYILIHGKIAQDDSCIAERISFLQQKSSGGSLNYGKTTDR